MADKDRDAFKNHMRALLAKGYDLAAIEDGLKQRMARDAAQPGPLASGYRMPEGAPAAIRAPSPEEQARIDGEAAAARKRDPFADADAPSPSESAVRSWLSTATRGYSDELAARIDQGLGKVGLGPEVDYEQRRDQYRARNHYAEKENPKASLAGTVAGVVMAPKLPVRGAVKTAGAEGLLFGHGASEAEDVGGQLRDTALGGTVGLVTGKVADKVGKAIGGAPARAEQRELGVLTSGTQNSTQIKVLGKNQRNAPAIRETMREADDVRKLATVDPPAALKAAETRLAPLTSRLDEIYDVAQTQTQGAPLETVLRELGQVKSQYRTINEEPMAKAIDELASRFVEKYDNKPVPLQELRSEVQSWMNKGYQGGQMFSVSAKKQFDRDVGTALRNSLQGEVEQVAQRNPELGISLQELQKTNKDVSTWIGITTLLGEKATRPPTAQTLADTLSKNSLRAGARDLVNDTVVEPADDVMAKLVQAARSGDGKAAAMLEQLYGAASRAGVAEASQAPAQALAPPHIQRAAEARRAEKERDAERAKKVRDRYYPSGK